MKGAEEAEVALIAKSVRETNERRLVGDGDVGQIPSAMVLIRGLLVACDEGTLASEATKLLLSSDVPPADASDVKSGDDGSDLNKIGSSDTDDAKRQGRKPITGSICRVMLIRDKKTKDSWGYGMLHFYDHIEAAAAVEYASKNDLKIQGKAISLNFCQPSVFLSCVYHAAEKVDDFSVDTSYSEDPFWCNYRDHRAYASGYLVNPDGNPKILLPQYHHLLLEIQTQSKPVIEEDGTKRSVKKRKVETTSAMPEQFLTWSQRSTAHLHQSYTIKSKLSCFLCERLFDSEAAVQKHIDVSKLHAANLKRDPKLSAAIERIRLVTRAAGTSSTSVNATQEKDEQPRLEAAPKKPFSFKIPKPS